MKKTKLGIVSAVVAGALVLGACGTSNTGGEAPGGGDSAGGKDDVASKYAKCDVTNGVKDAASVKIGADEDKKITLTAFSGWAESTATAYIMKAALNEQGYQAEVKTLDAAPSFTAVAQGDYDVVSDVWLPSTHKDYINKYGDKLEPQGCWYDNSTIEVAVPEYSPAKSLADLKTMASKYNNEIVGIEPGAGETQTMKDKTIPTYGLQDMDFKTSSTSAMLRSLDTAYKQKKNIAVTLWSPHDAYAKYKLRKLADPKKAMSGKEGLWNFATKGFGDKHPLASQLLNNLTWTEDDLLSLESVMVGKYDNKNPDKAVQEWLKDNPDFQKQLVSGQLKK